MPFFRTTQNIFVDNEEFFDENWMDSPVLITPPTKFWDYSRPLEIEDIDVWEVIWEAGGGHGVYAAWTPYAEFYMIRVGWVLESQGGGVETYYGAGAQHAVQKRIEELGFQIDTKKYWVEDDQMWLFEKKNPVIKKIYDRYVYKNNNEEIPVVSEIVKQDRLNICQNCPFYDTISGVCKECGCYMPIKAGLKDGKCPIHKW